ncbi:MAG TPA: PQQ-binding-like beta-propeller repeat protein, partial [Armatimonadota bacterium]|nr:PQQ-binding-like beta-propeller repeat protein [Armatimonadota bacterium]
PSLQELLRRFPDCWPARLVLALREWDGSRAPRLELNRVAARLPGWSAPAAFLSRWESRPGYFSTEARRLRVAERARLRQLERMTKPAPLAPPFRFAWRAGAVAPQTLLADDRGIFRRAGNELIHCSRANGAELDRLPAGSFTAPPGLSRDLVLAVEGRAATAYTREGLRLQWATPLPYPADVRGSQPPAVGAEHVVWLTESGALHCLRLADGALVWSAKLGAPPTAPLLLTREHCLAALQDGSIRRIRLADGTALPPLRIPGPGEARTGRESTNQPPTPTSSPAALGVVHGWLAVGDRFYASIRDAGNSGDRSAVACWKEGEPVPLWVTAVGQGGPASLLRSGAALLAGPDLHGSIAVLEADQGRVTRVIERPYGSSSLLVDVSGRHYLVRSHDQRLRLLRLSDGAQEWEGSAQGHPVQSVGRSGDLLLLDAGDAGLVALTGQPQTQPHPARLPAPHVGSASPSPRGRGTRP